MILYFNENFSSRSKYFIFLYLFSAVFLAYFAFSAATSIFVATNHESITFLSRLMEVYFLVSFPLLLLLIIHAEKKFSKHTFYPLLLLGFTLISELTIRDQQTYYCIILTIADMLLGLGLVLMEFENNELESSKLNLFYNFIFSPNQYQISDKNQHTYTASTTLQLKPCIQTNKSFNKEDLSPISPLKETQNENNNKADLTKTISQEVHSAFAIFFADISKYFKTQICTKMQALSSKEIEFLNYLEKNGILTRIFRKKTIQQAEIIGFIQQLYPEVKYTQHMYLNDRKNVYSSIKQQKNGKRHSTRLLLEIVLKDSPGLICLKNTIISSGGIPPLATETLSPKNKHISAQ